MRVGVIGPLGPDLFAANIGDALRSMGHMVSLLGPAQVGPTGKHSGRIALLVRQGFPQIDERSQRRILNSVLDAECELVINVDSQLAPLTVRRLKRAGVLVAFWFPDAVANLLRQTMLLAPYDALFFKEPHIVERLRANLDLPVYYLPEACNPRLHRPLVAAGTEPYLVIAGNMYASRVRLLERLLAKGIPLRLYGAGFPRWLGETPARQAHTGLCVFGEDKARVFRSATAVLNTLHPAEINGVNARLFEAAGSGAAILTEFRSSLPDLFTVGEEVLAFHDFEELVELSGWLLNESGPTERLGNAAARRAHRDHSYEARITTILEKVM